jgi:hypothetical protein
LDTAKAFPTDYRASARPSQLKYTPFLSLTTELIYIGGLIALLINPKQRSPSASMVI